MMAASGAKKVRLGLNYGAHAMGSCRMGNDAATSVVNPFCQSHDVKNLFICDTSVFVTGSGVNPTLTAMAIADRAAQQLIALGNNRELLPRPIYPSMTSPRLQLWPAASSQLMTATLARRLFTPARGSPSECGGVRMLMYT